MDALRIIKLLLGVVPFLVLCLLSLKVNLAKSNRGRQFAMPFVAFLYSVLAVVFFEKTYEFLSKGLDFLAGYVPLINNINIVPLMVFVINTAIMAVFLLIKGIFLPFLNKIWGKSKALTESTTESFYEYSDEYGKWFLKGHLGQLKKYYMGFYISAIVVSTALFLLSQYFVNSTFFIVPFYPVFGVIFLGEIVFFLSGLTKSEFIEDILGEDEESLKVANYGALRTLFHKLFSDRVLLENTSSDSGIATSSYALLDEISKNDNQVMRTVGKYFSELKESGKEVDSNYISSCIDMIEGKSVLIYNPFYRDLTEYIILPLIRNLMQYKKGLVLVGRDSSAEDVKNWLESGIREATNTGCLWRIAPVENVESEYDVGIIRFSDLYEYKMLDRHSDFFEAVNFVVLIEPSKMLATGQLALSLIVSKFVNNSENMVYCCCDRNCDGLVDALSHTLKTNITQVFASLSPKCNLTQMFWEADGEHLHHRLIPGISRYLGIGTELGSVAIKNQIQKVLWVSAERFPVIDMLWVMGQYYKPICNYVSIPQSQEELYEHFYINTGLWNLEIAENAFLIVEDEYYNAFEVSRNYASRARNQGFVNVISGNYLVREYMVENSRIFISDPKAIPTIVADFARTERNMVLKMVITMSETALSEQDIRKEFLLNGITSGDTYTTLKGLIIKHCDVADVALKVFFREVIDETTYTSKTKKYFVIENDTNIAYYSKRLKNAYILSEDEKGEKHFVCARLYGHIFQMYLPGQFFTYNGKYYEVCTASEENGIIVRRAADHITDRKYYRQIRSYHLTNWVEDTRMASRKTIGEVEFVNGYCDVEVQTHGYLELKSYDNFKSAKRHTVSGMHNRCYKNKNVLKVYLPECDHTVKLTICLLLNELFKTIYPDSWHYLSVLTVNDTQESVNTEGMLHSLSCDWKDDAIFVIEDSEIDLGIIVSVERNLERFFEIATDMLVWHKAKMEWSPPEKEEEKEYIPDFSDTPVKKQKKGILGIFSRIGDFFKGMFHKKKTTEGGQKPTEAEAPDDFGDENLGEQFEIGDNFEEEKLDLDVNTEAISGEKISDNLIEEQEDTAAVTKESTEGEDGTATVTSESTEGENGTATVTETSFEIEFDEEEENSATISDASHEDVENSLTAKDNSDEKIVETDYAEPKTMGFERDAKVQDIEHGDVDEALNNCAYDEQDTLPEECERTASSSDNQNSDNKKESLLGCEITRDYYTKLEEEIEPTEDTYSDPKADEPFDFDTEGDDEVLVESAHPEKSNYQKKNYLFFGFEDTPAFFEVDRTIEYFSQFGYEKNPLQQARENADLAAEIENTYDPGKAGAHFCDFCAVELMGGEYELLRDGRERCNFCSKTAIREGEEFKTIFKNVVRNMETFYGIKLNVAIKVRMTNAKKIARHFGEKFVATPGFDGRTLGFAKQDKDGYSIYVENGSPQLAAIATIAHELTHIWQYQNWDRKKIARQYGKENVLEVYEGMAKWAEIQYLFYMNEIAYAKRLEIQTSRREDEYGRGFLKYGEKYTLSYGVTKNKKTPFEKYPPL